MIAKRIGAYRNGILSFDPSLLSSVHRSQAVVRFSCSRNACSLWILGRPEFFLQFLLPRIMPPPSNAKYSLTEHISELGIGGELDGGGNQRYGIFNVSFPKYTCPVNGTTLQNRTPSKLPEKITFVVFGETVY